ncbi:hypothetical protein E2C01_080828 [Portunus trituberculatus]|uniref:Uncharacterized protein n=1 Tax=Portunus trituberculatus TaxID=210409 RepID=A0A5B7IWE2_PORTR|nr:hypothetical protein [Portunus trituberculatus]
MAAMAGAAALLLQEDVKILGAEVDRGLRFDSRVKTIAKKASHRISALGRVASFLDKEGRLLLYKAQVRPHLEYAALSGAATQRRKLDSIQRRALRLADAAPPPHPEPERPLDSLEHRRDVAGIVVFHKAQVQKVPHLAGLCHPLRVSTRSTRTVLNGGDAVEVPRSPQVSAPTHLRRTCLQDVELVHSRGASSLGDEHSVSNLWSVSGDRHCQLRCHSS